LASAPIPLTHARLIPVFMQTFRADIEGLRALAVILVILYHYQFPGVSGGFIGVDVFFVLSGFVITQLLTRSMAAGTFSFSGFYARRIRRLVPVECHLCNDLAVLS
jgi:peptidoglycan/LPS O-acetylase OafA/YrhL